jgi:lipid-A-disaccharide synthase
MVNLIAEREIVPELIQHEMTAAKIAAEAGQLLSSSARAERMRTDLDRVRKLLAPEGDPFERAASLIANAVGGRLDVQSFPRDLIRETIS